MLVVHIVHVCLCSAKCAPEAVCRYQEFVDEGCARRSARADLPVGEATNRMWPVHISMALKTSKKQVCCASHFSVGFKANARRSAQGDLPLGEATNRMWPLHTWMALKTGKKQVCCACDFSAGIKADFARKADATAARLRASQRACATTSPHLRMALKTGIKKKTGVLAPRHTRHFSAGIKNLWSNKKTLTLKLRIAASLAAHLWMALKTGKKQVCFACHFSAGIKILWSNTNTLNLELTMAASWAAPPWMALKTGKKQVCCACQFSAGPSLFCSSPAPVPTTKRAATT